MELLFIDESGDYGLVEGGSEFYILAGVSVSDSSWKEFFWQIQQVRSQIAQRIGLTFQELKGSDLFAHTGPFFNTSLKPHDLAWIHEQLMSLICDDKASLFVRAFRKTDFLNRFQVATNKIPPRLFNEHCWREFISGFENYLAEKTRQTGQAATGIVYFDHTPAQEKHVRKMVREAAKKFDLQAAFPAAGIVEDPVFRDSKESSFLQLADILAATTLRIVRGPASQDVFRIDTQLSEALKAKSIGR